MTETQRLAKTLNDCLERGVEFAGEQAPEVIQQFLFWKQLEAICWSAGAFALFLAIVAGGLVLWKKLGKIEDWEPRLVTRCLAGLVCGMASLFPIVTAFEQAMVAIHVYVAPKAFLAEYILQHI